MAIIIAALIPVFTLQRVEDPAIRVVSLVGQVTNQAKGTAGVGCLELAEGACLLGCFNVDKAIPV
jgi:hypothetical protein